MRKILFILFILTIFISGCTRSNQAPAALATDSVPANNSIPAPAALPTATPEPSPIPTEIPQLQVTAVTESAPVPETPPMSANDQCDNPYYPVVDGASWEYAISTGVQETHSMSVGEDKTFTLTVQGDNSTFTLRGQCTEDGIILMDVPGISSTYSDSEGGGGSTLTTDNVEGVTLPNDVQVGDDWSQKISVTGASGDGEVTLSATIETTYTAVGYEQVTVPAGTFYALKVEQNGTLTMNGGAGFDTHGFIWYAQGVGTVKSGLEGTYTSELTAYNIP